MGEEGEQLHSYTLQIDMTISNYVVFALPILLSFLTQSYTLQIDMTISNLPIPPDDPRGHPFRKTRKPGPALFTPTAI